MVEEIDLQFSAANGGQSDNGDAQEVCTAEQIQVTLTADEVRQAIQLLDLLTARQGGSHVIHSSPPGQLTREKLMAVATLNRRVRDGRARHFSRAMFGEPAWDLLLALYVAKADDRDRTVSNLAKAADTPITTAFRWLEYLEERGLIDRQPGPVDRRTSIVELSDRGRKSLDDYFADVFERLAADLPQVMGDLRD